MLPRNVLYYGKDEPLPERLPLRAGPLSMLYEAGELRYIRLGAREILRRVYVAVRDQNWDTAPSVFSNLQIDVAERSFRIAYEVDNRHGQVDFHWRGTISGSADGTLALAMDGVARSTFLRNRIGFCVLYPIRECAGAECTIEHVDGTIETSHFPRYIAPQSIVDGRIQPCAPFAELRALSQQVAPGLRAELRFAGDIFEMEDQRNWTDSSYKVYSTPLRLPFPAELPAGARVAQSLTLALREERPGAAADQRATVDTRSQGATPYSLLLDPASLPTPLPRLGLGMASHASELSARDLGRLRALQLAHLRVDLHLSSPAAAERLRQAGAQARDLGAALEVALFCSDDGERELRLLAERLAELQPPIAAWLVFHEREPVTSQRWVQLARQLLASYAPDAPIGAGTNLSFVDLNRQRSHPEAYDLVAYAINPQVHAFDNASLVETLAAQAATVASARQFLGARRLAISPLTLKPRFNPVATGPERSPAPGQLPAPVDVRQMSLFGAGWTLGSIKYLAESAVWSATYYETSGWRGVIETAEGSPLPDVFRSIAGGVFPLYHVLADVGEFAGGEVLASLSSDPLLLEGLALRKGGRRRILLASFAADPLPALVPQLGARVRVRMLDETSAEEAMRAPEAFRDRPGEECETTAGTLALLLPPFAVACIDEAGQ